MLTDILALFSQHHRLSLREISFMMKAEPSAVEPIMEILIKKGRVDKLSSGCSGGSCEGCHCAERESSMIYSLKICPVRNPEPF